MIVGRVARHVRAHHGRLPLYLLLALLLAACTGTSPSAPAATATLPAFATYRIPGILEFLYPDVWESLLVSEGLLLVAPPSTLQGENFGPQMTVLRQPAESVRTDLAGTLDHYLNSGPLAGGFTLMSEIEARPFAGRDGLAVSLSGRAREDTPVLQGYVVAVQANSGAVYIVSTTAVQAEWEQLWPIFEIAISSFALDE